MRKLLIAGMAALAAITSAPIAQADADASNLDQIVGQAYTQFQTPLHTQHDAAVPACRVGYRATQWRRRSRAHRRRDAGFRRPVLGVVEHRAISPAWCSDDRPGTAERLLGHHLRVLLRT